MTPGQQQSKDLQDESRRHQQADKRIRELEETVNRLKENNDVLGKIAHQLRGALQSIADDIGGQKTAQNALDRLASQGINGLDVDPEEVGIKGRIEELEAEVERLRRSLQGVRRLLYGSRAPFRKGDDRERPHHYESAVAPRIVTAKENEHPSSCSYRVEQIEAVAEIVETALNNDTDQ